MSVTPARTPFPELLRAARDGAPWACTRIWETYAGPVAGYARNNGSQEPDDLTSEVFLSLFRGLDGFEGGEDDLRALVFTIARRRLIDEIRRRGRRPSGVEWTPETDRRTATSAEDTALARHGTVTAQDRLARLSPDQREVLTLRIFGDLTIDQIAQEVGKRPGAVKALQRRGLEALRRQLAQDGDDGVPH